ncbi:MAG: hypothetical protein RL670_1114 [Actinomycetota bacterium]
MHANRNGRWAKLILIVGLMCFVLIGLLVRPASALTANPDAVCAGLDCTVTFGPSEEVYEWVAPTDASKVWVQLEGSQDVVSGAHGDFEIATFKSAPAAIFLHVGTFVELRSGLTSDSAMVSAKSGSELSLSGSSDPSLMLPDVMTSSFIAFVRHGGAPAGVGHAIVHYKQAAVQSPVPVAPMPTPTPTPTQTPTESPQPQPAQVEPSPATEVPPQPVREVVSIVESPVVYVPVIETPKVETPAIEVPPVQAPVVEDAPPAEPLEPVAQPIEIPEVMQIAAPTLIAKPAPKPKSHPMPERFRSDRVQILEFTPPKNSALPANDQPNILVFEAFAVATASVGSIMLARKLRRRKAAAHRGQFRLALS